MDNITLFHFLGSMFFIMSKFRFSNLLILILHLQMEVKRDQTRILCFITDPEAVFIY